MMGTARPALFTVLVCRLLCRFVACVTPFYNIECTFYSSNNVFFKLGRSKHFNFLILLNQ